jgi:hypothetical protein
MIPEHGPYAFHERMHEGGINEICHALEDTVQLIRKTIYYITASNLEGDKLKNSIL